GEVYDMTPAPSTKHQRIIGELYRMLGNFLEGKKCEVFVAPFDVRLSEHNASDFEVFNVVQPDISIFCDEKKIDEKGAKGAPDFVVEILSPSTSKKDLSRKLLLYQKFKVKEYWII